jgi:addiction module HigA family antidote
VKSSSAYWGSRLAKDIHIPVTRIADIVNEKRGISADTALRQPHYFGNSAEFWLNLQSHYELQEARECNRQDDVLTIARYDYPPVAA